MKGRFYAGKGSTENKEKPKREEKKFKKTTSGQDFSKKRMFANLV